MIAIDETATGQQQGLAAFLRELAENGKHLTEESRMKLDAAAVLLESMPAAECVSLRVDQAQGTQDAATPLVTMGWAQRRFTLALMLQGFALRPRGQATSIEAAESLVDSLASAGGALGWLRR